MNDTYRGEPGWSSGPSDRLVLPELFHRPLLTLASLSACRPHILLYSCYSHGTCQLLKYYVTDLSLVLFARPTRTSATKHRISALFIPWCVLSAYNVLSTSRALRNYGGRKDRVREERTREGTRLLSCPLGCFLVLAQWLLLLVTLPPLMSYFPLSPGATIHPIQCSWRQGNWRGRQRGNSLIPTQEQLWHRRSGGRRMQTVWRF